MARKPRAEVDGGIFHVYARGNDGRALFVEDADRHRYLRGLAAVVGRLEWSCLAYCLMGNHLHLLVETPCANLGAGMRRLHGEYARSFHDRHGTSGHVFQGRYGARRARTDGQFQNAVAYIACNPCEAGMCRRPEDWFWSSHAAVLNGHAPRWLDHERLLAYLGAQGGDARRRYRELIDGRHAVRSR
jgi:REP element-mobilizing transposase RayT